MRLRTTERYNREGKITELQTPHATGRPQASWPDAKLQERFGWRRRGRLFAPIDSGRTRRIPLAHNLWLLVLTVAYMLASPHPVLAAQSANFVNQTTQAIFVNFFGGPISWQVSQEVHPSPDSCVATGNGVQIAPGDACLATVESINSGSRFCASPYAPPKCEQAQDNHQTLIETTFNDAAQCAFTGQPGPCVWYDISLIPIRCTDEFWRRDECAGGGGASYNLPVKLTCPGQPPAPTFTCQGPTGATWGPQHYPNNCGNPNATCVGDTSNCVNAYFFPMFTPPENKFQPNAVCSGGRTLQITFLAGP
jgi:hypothetical protein